LSKLQKGATVNVDGHALFPVIVTDALVRVVLQRHSGAPPGPPVSCDVPPSEQVMPATFPARSGPNW